MHETNGTDSALMHDDILSKKTVLIVDDDDDYAEALEEVFQVHSCNPVCLKDPKCAIEYALDNHFDLLIVDKNMPCIDGIEFSKRVKAKKPTANIILITAYPNEETRKKSLEIGIRYYLSKPFRKEHLLEIVSFILL